MWKVPEPLASELVKDRAAALYERAQVTVRGYVVAGLLLGAGAGWLGAIAYGAASTAVLVAAAGGMVGVWTGAAFGRRRSLGLLMEGHQALGQAFSSDRKASEKARELPN